MIKNIESKKAVGELKEFWEKVPLEYQTEFLENMEYHVREVIIHNYNRDKKIALEILNKYFLASSTGTGVPHMVVNYEGLSRYVGCFKHTIPNYLEDDNKVKRIIALSLSFPEIAFVIRRSLIKKMKKKTSYRKLIKNKLRSCGGIVESSVIATILYLILVYGCIWI